MSASSRVPVVPWLFALAALGIYLACREEEERPAGVGDCDGCVGPIGYAPITNVPLPMGGSGGAGPGTGGDGGGAGTGTLVGNVDAVVEPDLSSADVGQVVSVRAAGQMEDQVIVDAALDGSFRLEGVERSAVLWVGTGTFSNDPASLFMDTLQVVNGQRGLPVELLVMRRPVFEQIVQAGFTSNPVELAQDRGHVILRFQDRDSQGISGISLVAPAPEDTSVTYDLGDTFSDLATETAARGTMVLINLPATAYPGSATTVTTTNVDGLRRDVDVRTAAGAVTLVTTFLP
jgi:hypothetical protein